MSISYSTGKGEWEPMRVFGMRCCTTIAAMAFEQFWEHGQIQATRKRNFRFKGLICSLGISDVAS